MTVTGRDAARSDQPDAATTGGSGVTGGAGGTTWVGGSGGTGPASVTVNQQPPLAGRSVFATGARPRSMVAGDFNGDGKLDLATANSDEASVTVLLSKGSQMLATRVDHATGAAPYGIVAGDWNEDGKLDLATANREDQTVTVFVNRGDGTFIRKSDISLGYPPDGMVAADLEPNGIVDLAIANSVGRAVSVLLSKGDGTFLAKPDVSTDPLAPGPLVSADFNGDGHPDLVFGNLAAYSGETGLGLVAGKGGGAFAAPRAFGGPSPIASIAIGDFDDNSKLDLGVGDSNTRSASGTTGVLRGNGDGTFQPEISYDKACCAFDVTAGDVDGDGRMDLIANRGYILSILFGQQTGVLVPSLGAQKDIVMYVQNQEDRRLLCVVKNADLTSSSYYSGLDISAVTVGDFNGDGKPDLAMAEWTYSVVFLLMGSGGRTFVPPAWCP